MIKKKLINLAQMGWEFLTRKNVDGNALNDANHLTIFDLKEYENDTEAIEHFINDVFGVDTKNNYHHAKQRQVNQILKDSEYYQKNKSFFEELSEEEQEDAFKRIRLHSRQWVSQHSGFNFIEYLSDPQTRWLAKDWRWTEESFWFFDFYSLPPSIVEDYIVDEYLKSECIRLKDACYLLVNIDPVVFENLSDQVSQTQMIEFQNVRDELLSIISTTMDSKILVDSQINLCDLGRAILLSDIGTKSYLRSKLRDLIENESIEMKVFLAREIVVSRNLLAYKKMNFQDQQELEKHLVILLGIEFKMEDPSLSRRGCDTCINDYLLENFQFCYPKDNLRGRFENFDKKEKKNGDKLNFFTYMKSLDRTRLEDLVFVLDENYPIAEYKILEDLHLKIIHKPFALLMPESA